MWAFYKVAEEGGAQISAGMETSQDKVWIFWRAAFLLTDILDRRGALPRRQLFPQVMTLTAIRGRRVERILWSSRFLLNRPSWIEWMLLDIRSTQLGKKGLP